MSPVNTVQNHLSDFFAMLLEDRGVVPRRRIHVEAALGNAGPSEVSVTPRLRFIDDQRNAPWIFFRSVTVQQAPVANFGLIKAIHLARLRGGRDFQLSMQQLANGTDSAPIARMDDLGEDRGDMPDSLPHEIEIGQNRANGGWPLGIEKNHQSDFLAFLEQQPGDFESCDTANTVAA